MSAKKRFSLFRKTYSVISELAVTDINPGSIKIDKSNRLKYKDIMVDRMQDFTDENFWENYNIIEPDQTIESIISRIGKQLKRR